MAGYIGLKWITDSVRNSLVRAVVNTDRDKTEDILEQKLGYRSIDEFMRNARLK